MRIHRIKIENFRGINEAEIDFSLDGITIVEGPNEAGKSSLAESIDLILEYPDSSSKAALQEVRPVNRDTGTTVELEFSTGPYHLIYTKTWFRHPGTTLQILKPTPGNVTGRRAHDRVREIIGETVDEALFAALRYKQGDAITQAMLEDSVSLATALDTAASGQSSAGLEEANLFERVGTERERFFTPTGKLLANRVQRASRIVELETSINRLRVDLADLEDKADRYRQLDEDVRHLDVQRSAEDENLIAANSLWMSIQASRVNIAEMESELQRRENAATEVRNVAAGRRGLVDLLGAAQKSLGSCEIAAQRDHPATEAAQLAVDEVSERRIATRAVRVSVEGVAKRARDDAEHLRQLLNLQLWGERRNRVLAEQKVLIATNGFLESCRMTGDLLSEIEKASVAVTEAGARLSASAAKISIEALCEVSLVIDGAHHILDASETFETTIAGDTRLELENVARIRVSGPASERQLTEQLEVAQRYLQSLLTTVDIDHAAGVVEARRLEWARQEAVIKRVSAVTRIEEDLRDLTFEELCERLAITETRVAEFAADRPADSILPTSREEAETVERLVTAELENVLEQESLLDGKFDEVVAALAAIQEAARERSMSVTIAEAEVESARDRLETARMQTPDAELDAELTRRDDEAHEARKAFDIASQALASSDPDTAEVRLENARALVKRLAREHEEANISLVALRSELAVRGESGLRGQLDDDLTSLLQVTREHEQVERLAVAADFLFAKLSANREAAQRSYVAPYRVEIERLGRIVFGADFQVEVDHGSLQIVNRTLSGVTVPFKSLSGGTREQLCVLSLLACAALVNPTGADSGVPVILDDALGWSDPNRLALLGSAFSSASSRCQVIALTCVPDRYRGIGNAQVRKMFSKPSISVATT